MPTHKVNNPDAASMAVSFPSLRFGAIAQLGERLHGMQEVSGSIPLGSTNYLTFLRLFEAAGFLCCR